jgi:L-asparaginase/Glu-tRNA(Gln) amidotransferase subunit D
MSSGEAGLVGATLFGKDTWFRTPSAVHTKASEFSIDGVSTLPRVDIIYAHANMSPDIITSAVQNGAKGLVIAGVGDGNMTAPAVEAERRRSRRAWSSCGRRGPTAASSVATSSSTTTSSAPWRRWS